MAPGESWYYPIDGIAIPGVENSVFKVLTHFDEGGVDVWSCGVTIGTLPSMWALSLIFNELYGGGWRDESYQQQLHSQNDYGWDSLYDKATGKTP